MDNLPDCPPEGTGMSPQSGLHVLSMGVCAFVFVMQTIKFFRQRRNDNQETSEEISAQQRQFNEKRCIRCCVNFTVLKRKFFCQKCNFAVCKACAAWEPVKQCWLCRFCSSRESSPSPEWLQKKLLERCRVFESARRVRRLQKLFDEYDRDNDSGYDPSMSVASEDILGSGFGEPAIDPTVLEIHEHVEAIIEQIIGDAIDNTTLDPLCHNPEYDRMIEIYHGRLCEALSLLIQSIRLATNKQAMAADQTPTASHSALKHIIYEVVEEAMGLPYLVQETDSISSELAIRHQKDEDGDDDLENQSYEEILSTVILNKVIEMYQKQKYAQRHSPDALPCYASINGLHEANNNRLTSSAFSNKEIQTDLDTDAESEITKKSANRIVHSSPTMDFSDNESCSFGTESAGEDFSSWARAIGARSPSVQYMVEEQFEEITTTFEDPNADEGKTVKRGERRFCEAVNAPLLSQTFSAKHSVVPDLSHYCHGLEFAESRKVPFPEFGIDFIDGELADEDDNGSTALYSAIERWEDNWLFRKKKRASAFRNMGNLFIGDEPISMLVPNPQEDVRAKIGDRDVDELSDMSEKLSSGSLELSNSDPESKDGLGGNEYQESKSNILQQSATNIWVLRNSLAEAVPQTVVEIRKPSSSNGCACSTGTLPAPPSPKRPTEQEPLGHDTNNELQPPVAEEMRPESHQQHLPVPKPRKSKSSTHSDRELPVAGKRAPRFAPLASRPSAGSTTTFARLPESTSVLAGRMARVTCQTAPDEPYNVCWFHGCEPLECGELYQFYSIGDRHILEIYDAQEMDGGTYSCVAYTESEETWADFKLSVVGSSPKPSCPQFKQHLRSSAAEEGQTVSLHCKVLGSPEPQLALFKDNQLLHPSKHISIDRKSHGDWAIQISNATLKDSGNYRLVARNKAGEATSVAEIAIEPSGSLEAKSLPQKTKHVQDTVHVEAEGNKEAASGIRQVNGKAPNLLINGAIKSKDEKSNAESASLQNELQPVMLRLDAIPGTIAEREHKKWQNPVALPNNPYSPENIAKRIRRSESLTRSPQLSDAGSPVSPALEQDLHSVVILNGPKKIDCGLKDIDPEKYRRDYYVHHGSSAPASLRRFNSEKAKKTPAALNDVEEKVHISTGRVLVLGDKVKDLEPHVSAVDDQTSPAWMNVLEDKVARAVAQVNQSDKQVSKVEQEVARLQKQILEKQPSSPEDSPLANGKNGIWWEEFGSTSSLDRPAKSKESSPDSARADSPGISAPVPLPSVRALANKFDGPAFQKGLFPNGSFEHKDDGTTIVRIEAAKLPTPRPRRSKPQDGPSCDSPVHEPSHEPRDRLSISSTASSLSAELPPEVATNRPSDPTNPETSSEEARDDRPSVKVLSQKFFEETGEGTLPSGSATAVKRVHSLTARSLSKEFRDATQYHLPRQLNRKISITNDPERGLRSIFTPPLANGINGTLAKSGAANGSAPPSPEDGHGYTSDESSASSTSVSRAKPTKKLSRSIQSRAAFWDRRVKEERMTDHAMSDEFPPMESPEYST